MRTSVEFLLAVLLSILLAAEAHAYKTDTHKKISQKAADFSPHYKQFVTEFHIDPNNAGSSILYGSVAEDDDGFLRFLTHFYDPINERGLGRFAPAPSWGYNDSGNDYSWTKARSYIYQALTGVDEGTRNGNFQKLFRSLGQVIHLVQDMAQPSHTRNDPHVSHYEPFGDVLAPKFNPSHLEDWANFNASDVITFTKTPIGPVSVTAFDDVFEGLALYSNENFFSDDTIFQNYFYPSYEETNYESSFINFGMRGEPVAVVAEDGHIYYVPYLYKTQGVPGGYKLAQVGYFGDMLADNPAVRALAFQIDDEVAKDNAEKLLPLATGFSAKLLDYFFRGQLEVTLMQGGLKVKNLSSETMDSYPDPDGVDKIGALSVYYDTLTQTRERIITEPLLSPINPGDEITISFPRPTNNLKGRYIVVFQGKLGSEEGAVIGALSPPPLYYVSKRSGAYKIFHMDADGGKQEVVYDNQNPNLTISKLAISPDGKTLAFTVDGPRIYLLDLVSHALSELTQGDWPDWSPDGKTIVFERDVTPPEGFASGVKLFSVVEVFTRNILNGSEVQLTHTYTTIGNTTAGSFNGHPSFSPDGRTIAYTRWPADQADCNNPTSFMIYLMDTSGNSNGPLTCDEEKAWLDAAPSWSPDGHEIAFLRRWDQEFYQLYKVSVDTKTITKLTESDGTAYAELTPSWSSDGKVIAIGSNRDGNFDIWRVSPAGGGYLSNLTAANPDIDGFPAYVK